MRRIAVPILHDDSIQSVFPEMAPHKFLILRQAFSEGMLGKELSNDISILAAFSVLHRHSAAIEFGPIMLV
ncbi:hypothetical protein EV128_108208 [Rhizobium azibense]|nr:hypothetical protein EV128_108208 [Rhizobium azibense]